MKERMLPTTADRHDDLATRRATTQHGKTGADPAPEREFRGISPRSGETADRTPQSRYTDLTQDKDNDGSENNHSCLRFHLKKG